MVVRLQFRLGYFRLSTNPSGDEDSADKLGLDSTTGYLTDQLSVNMEDAGLLVVMETVQAPAVGEISRKGFLDGWKATGYVSVPDSPKQRLALTCPSRTSPTTKDQAKYIKSTCKKLSGDPALFKRVYRYTFNVAKEPDQKAISLEHAMIYWDVLFSPPGWQWSSANRDWLALYKEYLNAKWTRSVNKDMWNQTLEFAVKSLEDESLSFWNEDGAWPSVIDDFVEWCRKEKGIAAESMDTDA